jgi:hypothetical protein
MQGARVIVAVVIGAGLFAPQTPAVASGVAAPAQAPVTAVTPVAVAASAATARAPRAGQNQHIAVTRWSSTRQLRNGSGDGVRVRGGALRFERATARRAYDDPYGRGGATTYGITHWTSPWAKPGFGLTEMVASWNATTPKGTWIEVLGRGRTSKRTGSWDVLGRWAGHDAGFHRTSVRGQGDDLADVAVDTVRMNGSARYTSWQLRVTLLRPRGSEREPAVQSIGAMASRVPSGAPATSRTTMRRTVDITVPKYSQMIHRGEYPRYDNGGEAWCSPTSVAMLLAHWKAGPTRREYAWVKDSYAQPWVDHAARNTFDYSYDGAGNWPFSTAYAGKQGLDAFVTRLRSLRGAEGFIRAGIPLTVSIAYGSGELHGSPIGSTAGHLLVVRGFTEAGHVITNDPAAASSSGVRRVYKRGQFERAWLSASGGLTYVVHPARVALPARSATSPW